MKRNNKKGFTIVELVIVIAVIAILSAVLIPTFSGIVKKARISADTQVARNLNTSLAADEALNGKPENFNEVLNILKNDGYIISNINPTMEGWYYVWESESNQILLVDGKYNVKHSAKPLENDTIGSTWYFAVSNANLTDTLTAKGANVAYVPKTTENFANVFENISNANKDQTITIVEDLKLSGDFVAIKNNDSTAKVGLDLSGNTITTNGESIPITVSKDNIVTNNNADVDKPFGQLTAAGGVLTIANGTIVNDTDSPFAISAIDKGVVYIENVTVDNKSTAAANGKTTVALRVFGTNAKMHVKDTNINITAQKSGGIEVGSGEATFENVTINVNNNNYDWASTCLMASRGGKLIVKSGSYTSNGYGVVGFMTSAGTVEISGGSFKAEDNAKLFNIAYRPSWAGTEHKIIITGGTFNGTAFADITTQDAWAALCGYQDYAAAQLDKVTITIENGTVTIIAAK